MKIRCQVIWAKLGTSNSNPQIRVKYDGKTSDWLDVEKAPALLSYVAIDEELLHERPTDGPTRFVSFSNA